VTDFWKQELSRKLETGFSFGFVVLWIFAWLKSRPRRNFTLHKCVL